MRSRIEGFDVVDNMTTSNLAYAVEFYGVPVGYFASYGSAMLSIVHWMRNADAFAYVLNEELDSGDIETIYHRLEARNREALIERNRR